MTAPGWIGDAEQLFKFLEEIGADRDEEGRFCIYGPEDSAPMSFLGMDQEYVIRSDLDYSVDGVRNNLADGLREARLGLSVMVL